MEKIYKLRKSYPGSPKEGTELHLHKPIVGFPYYTDEDHIFHIKKEHVEDYPEYFENVTKGMVRGDTVIEGVDFTLKDGTKFYQPLSNPIIYRTTEENNKNR